MASALDPLLVVGQLPPATTWIVSKQVPSLTAMKERPPSALDWRWLRTQPLTVRWVPGSAASASLTLYQVIVVARSLGSVMSWSRSILGAGGGRNGARWSPVERRQIGAAGPPRPAAARGGPPDALVELAGLT